MGCVCTHPLPTDRRPTSFPPPPAPLQIVCNWLVTTAVWVSLAAADLVSKALAILMIITIFASLGFEHSVANMFVGPFGALQKASRTGFFKFFFKNLVPGAFVRRLAVGWAAR